MIRVSRVKLGKARKAEQALDGVLERLRWLYNACIEQRRDAWRKQRKSLGRYDQQKELTELRREDGGFKNLPVEMTRATTTTRADLAFKAFFRRMKAGERPGFPRFRSRGRFDTLVFGKAGWQLDGKWLVLNIQPNPIRLRMKNTIHRQGEIKGVRIVRKVGRCWAHFIVDIGAAPAVKRSGAGVGIDVGLRTFATLSDGKRIEHPHFLHKSLDQLRAAQQHLSRCKKKSKRRAKRRAELARVHERIANRRREFVHQTVASLTKTYDGFAVEDLDIQQMASAECSAQNVYNKVFRGFRRGIMDSGWTKFSSHLAAKAEEAGLPFVRVDPKGTSQQCSQCGSLVRKGLQDRVHECIACGLTLDRDENAARNILDRGWRSARGLPGAEVTQ